MTDRLQQLEFTGDRVHVIKEMFKNEHESVTVACDSSCVWLWLVCGGACYFGLPRTPGKRGIRGT